MCVCACVCVHACDCMCLRRPEASKSPGAGVTGSFKLLGTESRSSAKAVCTLNC